mgnify:CR=1 FL=1
MNPIQKFSMECEQEIETQSEYKEFVPFSNQFCFKNT